MSMDVHGMQRLARLQLEEVTWTCINTQERTDALEMKKCVFENLKGDFFFFLMHLSSCLLLFEAINNQNFPVSSALLLSLISLSLSSALFRSFPHLYHVTFTQITNLGKLGIILMKTKRQERDEAARRRSSSFHN